MINQRAWWIVSHNKVLSCNSLGANAPTQNWAPHDQTVMSVFYLPFHHSKQEERVDREKASCMGAWVPTYSFKPLGGLNNKP